MSSVCAHKIINGVLSVVQTDRHITYVSMDNVEYVNAVPYAQPKPTMTKGSNDNVD